MSERPVVIYIAPMKSLVQEFVRTLGKLRGLSIHIAELYGIEQMKRDLAAAVGVIETQEIVFSSPPLPSTALKTVQVNLICQTGIFTLNDVDSV